MGELNLALRNLAHALLWMRWTADSNAAWNGPWNSWRTEGHQRGAYCCRRRCWKRVCWMGKIREIRLGSVSDARGSPSRGWPVRRCSCRHPRISFARFPSFVSSKECWKLRKHYFPAHRFLAGVGTRMFFFHHRFRFHGPTSWGSVLQWTGWVLSAMTEIRCQGGWQWNTMSIGTARSQRRRFELFFGSWHVQSRTKHRLDSPKLSENTTILDGMLLSIHFLSSPCTWAQRVTWVVS